MKRVAILAFVVGCAGATTQPARSRPAPTEADACERICSIYDECHISPPNCATGCAAEQKNLRDGIEPSLVACLETELDHCELRPLNERRQIVSICFAAVVEAYAKDDSAVNKIVAAVCAQQDRCAPDADPQCSATLSAKLKASTQSKTLAIARPELIDRMAACIEKASCNDPDPVGSCAKELS